MSLKERLAEQARDYARNPAPPGFKTASGRCVERGISLGRGALIQVGRRASRTYQKIEGRKPLRAPEVVRFTGNDDGELVATTYVFAYGEKDLPILDEAIDWALNRYGQE